MSNLSLLAKAILSKKDKNSSIRKTNITYTYNLSAKELEWHHKKDEYQHDIRIIFFNGKAYFPTLVFVEGNWWIETAPLYIEDINLTDLSKRIEEERKKKIFKIDNVLGKKIAGYRSPNKIAILKATGLQSINELNQKTVNYSIYWYDYAKEITLTIFDPKDLNSSKKIILKYNTSIEHITQIILEDLKKYPQVLKNNNK